MTSDTRTVFLLGKPGCGKGTQAKLLAEKTGWPVFSSGRLFREIEKEDSTVGRKIKEENDAGYLSPHWFAMYLYLKSLFSIPEGQSAIFDGFNRKVPEAELIIDSLKWLGRSFVVFNISISDQEVHTRIDGRSEIIKRGDDDAVEERIREYREYTVPAIELFRKAGTLVELAGERTPEAIAADIQNALALT